MITREALRVLENNLQFTKQVARQYDSGVPFSHDDVPVDDLYTRWVLHGGNLSWADYQKWWAQRQQRQHEEREYERQKAEAQRALEISNRVMAEREAALRKAREEEAREKAREEAYERQRTAALAAIKRQEEYRRFEEKRKEHEAEDLKCEAEYLEFRNRSEPWITRGALPMEEAWELSPDVLELTA